jgi:hypothetical protein
MRLLIPSNELIWETVKLTNFNGSIKRGGVGLVWAVLIGVVLHPTTINRTKRRETGENRVCADSRFMPTNLCPVPTHVN